MIYRHERGFGTLKYIFLGLGLIGITLAGWFGYVEYRRNYWDGKVRELCAKEGGMKIFERIALADKRYIDADGNIRIPMRLKRLSGYAPLDFEAKPEDMFYSQLDRTIIRDKSPRVARDDLRVVRSSDGRVMGQMTSFGRVGGDFIVIDAESRFLCPKEGESQLLKLIFIVNNDRGNK